MLGTLKPQLRQHLLDTTDNLSPGGVCWQAQASRIPQGLPHGEVRVQDIVLRDITNPTPEKVQMVMQVESANEDLAHCRDNRAIQHGKEGAFPRPAGPHDRHQLAGIDNEG